VLTCSDRHPGPVQQSFAQGRLWFLEELYPGLILVFMPFAVCIRGLLQLPSLNSALPAIERCHETPRTTFATGVRATLPGQGAAHSQYSPR